MSKFTKVLIKDYDEDSDKGYILEVYVKYPKTLHDLHGDLPFSPERMKEKICCSHKILKTSFKSWVNI